MAQGLRQRVRYRFDNLMARGIGAQILLLAVITIVLILLATVAVILFGVTPEPDEGQPPDGFGRLVWKGLMHALDAGAVGGDPIRSWTFLAIMLVVTIGGIFVLSALIGILNNGFGAMLEELRKGKSAVIERDHTVILGYTPKIHTLLAELAEANANKPGACVVVLANRDKVAMDEEVASHLASMGKRLRVVTRSGSPMALADVELVSLPTSKAVIVLAPETNPDGSQIAASEADTIVLKTLLAIAKVGSGSDLHVVAEIQDERTEAVARMVVGDRAALILARPLISRLLVQTGRQSGLSVVYSELLDFGGVEMYLKPEPALVGRTFRAALFAYDDSAAMGVLAADGTLLLPPPFDRRIEPGDQIIAISEDDDTVILNGKPVALPESVIVAAARQSSRQRERTLVLGASPRLGLVLRELDAYVSPGSETLVVGEAAALGDIDGVLAELRNMQVVRHAGDVTDRAVLDALQVPTFDHVLVLSETAARDQDMADARTMIALLHLRDIARRSGRAVPITSEILDIQNRDLAAVAEADDFIISNTLVSLLVSQVSENRHLVGVFDELFTAGGHEIYLKPAAEFVPLDIDLPYQAVVEAAARRGEIAIGYRRASASRDASVGYGVAVNPAKSATVRFTAADKVIVLADD